MNNQTLENTTGPDWWTLNPNDERYKENYEAWQKKQEEIKDLQTISSTKLLKEEVFISFYIGFSILFIILVVGLLWKKRRTQEK